MNALEQADIDKINFKGHDSRVVEVRGYQNYNLTPNGVEPINNPTKKRPWVDTKVKSDFFIKLLDEINPTSYADFGSNLGYYVFLLASKGIKSCGVDYNSEYIDLCNVLKKRFDIKNATFNQTKLEWWKEDHDMYDLVTVFNVIHHLYNRTEKYKDMGKLVDDFAIKSYNVVLFEFPTENDSKGHKWTMNTDYSEELFVRAIERRFKKYIRIEGQTEHRPYYLCRL